MLIEHIEQHKLVIGKFFIILSYDLPNKLLIVNNNNIIIRLRGLGNNKRIRSYDITAASRQSRYHV